MAWRIKYEDGSYKRVQGNYGLDDAPIAIYLTQEAAQAALDYERVLMIRAGLKPNKGQVEKE